MKNKLLAILCIGLLPFSMAFANAQDSDSDQVNSQDTTSQESLDVHSDDQSDSGVVNGTDDDSSVTTDEGGEDEGNGNYVEHSDDDSTAAPEENEDVDPNADNDVDE